MRLAAFDSERSARHVLPNDPAGQLVGGVTELRYLRSDLHAAALAEHALAGPRTRALHDVWTGADPDPDRLADLRQRDLVAADATQLTDGGRALVEVCERRTNELTDQALTTIDQGDLNALVAALRLLPGEDPRPVHGR